MAESSEPSPLYKRGLTLTTNACLSCHSSSSNIAPSFTQISNFYKTISSDNQILTNKYKKFLTSQKEEDILFTDAHKKYGAMPKITLSVEDAEAISYYLAYSNFQDLNNSITTQNEKPHEKGNRITSITKADIGQNLMKALKEKKAIGALAFCREQAIPITNIHAQKSEVVIKRATDKARNPKNLANKEELKYIRIFKKNLLEGKTPTAVLLSDGNEYRYYSPIVTNNLCLQCHGTKNTDIQNDVWNKIKDLYPNDSATGYSSDELRGIFSIRWREK